MTLDETAHRRDGFTRGVAIELADGQAWHFPRPLLGLLPEEADDGSVRFGERARCVFGAAYDALVDAFLEADDGRAEVDALLALAVDLLRRNYDLPAGALRALLPRVPDLDSNTRMWRAIADLALGRAPKPTPVG